MKYLSKKDNKTKAEFVSQDERTKVVRIRMLNGEREGKCIDVSPTTLQRWWKNLGEESEIAEGAVEETVTEEPVVEASASETIHVEVTTDEGQKISMDINPDDEIAGVDDIPKTYDFNNADKKYIQTPESVKELYKLGKDPYPTVEEVVDMMVDWGARIKAYAEWIKMLDGTRVIFRRNSRCPKKSLIEVRMHEEKRIIGFETQYVPLKGALLKATPYVIYVKTIRELETVIKSLLAAE